MTRDESTTLASGRVLRTFPTPTISRATSEPAATGIATSPMNEPPPRAAMNTPMYAMT